MDYTEIKIGEFKFQGLQAGDPGKDLIIFLHGFPEGAVMWENLMQSIAQLGYFCWAPNMRGYSPKALPKGKKAYAMEQLTQDILDMADHFEAQTFHLVGHDWGAAIGWNLVYHHADRIKSWLAFSVPHSRAYGKAWKTDKEQKKKSGYIKWFLLPYLPEWYIKRNDFKGFRRLWRRCSPRELEAYLQIFRHPGSLTAALNYYRANLGKGAPSKLGKVKVKTTFIWGNRDLAVGRKAAELNASYMDGPYHFVELDAGHWLTQEKKEDLERLSLAHFES